MCDIKVDEEKWVRKEFIAIYKAKKENRITSQLPRIRGDDAYALNEPKTE